MTAELSLVLKATIALTAGLAVVALSRRAPASVRHLVLSATLAVLMALPIAGALLPDLTVAIPVPAGEPTNATSPAPETALGSATSVAIELAFPRETTAPASRATLSRVDISLAEAVRLVWAGGAALLLGLLAFALWKVQRIRRTGIPWIFGQSLADEIAKQSGLQPRATVMLHEDIAAPVTCGWRHPAIVLPDDARSWSKDDLQRTFVHELEHVRRSDWITQLTARMICAAYWFHPLTWMVWRRLCLECERACDDAVVSRMEHTDYAEQLVTLAERMSARDAQPVLSMARRSDLSVRVKAVLDATQLRGRAGAAAVAAACGLAAVFSLVVAPMRVEAVRDLNAGDDLASARGDLLTAGGEMASAAGELAAARDAITSDGDDGGQRGSRERRDDRFEERTNRIYSRLLAEGLLEAVQKGDIGEVSALLQSGLDVNTVVRGDGTPLLVAAQRGQQQMVEFLLQRGADPNITSHGDGSPLIVAARHGHRRVVEALINAGADVDLSVDGDGSPLIRAAEGGHTEIVRLLLDRRADVDKGVDGDGSPLIEAASNGYMDIVQLLVARGADINMAVEGDGSPLIAAASRGHIEIMRFLLDRGAVVDQVVTRDENALISAAAQGQLAAVRLLVSRGANVNARVWAEDYWHDGRPLRGEWRTALNQARRNRHADTVRYLQSVGAVE
jgi:ankyrin repeat protein/beta-lactamase regulating signal transducer with metallopeptidase domain